MRSSKGPGRLLLGLCLLLPAGAAAQLPDLPCGSPFVGELSAERVDQYQFVAEAGDAVALEAIDLTGAIGLVNIRIYTPSADLLIETCRGRVSETLPESGTYRVEVSDCMRNDGEAGPYAVTLSGTSATLNGHPNCGLPIACNVTAVSGTLPAMDVPVASVFGGVVAYRLDTSAGPLQIVSGETSPSVGLLEVRVYSPAGELLASTCEGTIQVDVGAGVHTVLVNACTNIAAGEFKLSIAAPCALTCDVPLRRAVVDPAAGDAVAFEVAEGEIVSVSVLTDPPRAETFAASWVLVDFAGTPVFPCNDFIPWGPHTICGPLSAAGNPYYVAVNDFGATNPGTYTIAVQRLTVGAACEDTPLTCSVPLRGVVRGGIDTDLLSFSAAEGEVVAITVVNDVPSGPDFVPAWRLLDAGGNPAGGRCGLFSPALPFFVCDPLPAGGNPYRVEVGDSDARGAGAFRALLTSLSGACTTCTGDCDGSGTVSIDELIRGVRVALAPESYFECPALDGNLDGQVRIDELLVSVNRALQGCS